MNQQDPVVVRMTSVFRDVFDDDSLVLRDEMTAADVDGWDSLNHMNLIVAIEKTFGVRLTTAEAGSSLANVGELKALIDRKLASKK